MKEFRNEYDKYIHDKVEEIESHLSKYIELSGIQITNNNMFSCPNKAGHKNNDAKPAANITLNSNKQVWNCFACGAAGGTIWLAHYHEGLPTRGPEFMTKTIPELCRKLDIEWDPESVMTEEMKEIYLMYYANELIAREATNNLLALMSSHTDNPVISYINERGLTRQDIISFEIGYLTIDDAVSLMSKYEIPREISKEIGIDPNNMTSRKMFSESGLLFALRKHNDRIVGFASRNLNHGQPGESGAKYINTHNNRIFEKKAFLYGLQAAKNVAQEKRNIHIYEGYLDVITSYREGIKNCCAICSASFTEDHLNIIYGLEITSVTFAMDGDKAGNKGVTNAIEKLFSDNKMITPFIVEIPGEHDPDSFIRENSAEQFNELQRMNIIEYKIRNIFSDAKTNEMLDLEENIEKFFSWLINYEPNPIKRLKCLKILSDYTGHSQQDLRSQIEFQSKMMSDKTMREVDSIWYNMVSNGRSAILKDRITVLDETRSKLTGLIGETNIDIVSTQTNMITKIQDELKTNIITPIKFGWTLFDTNIMVPRDASLIMIGAYPNIGKSIMMRNMAMNLVEYNQDVGVIYFSMDDPMKATLPGLIAKLMHIKINDIRYPNLLPPDLRKEVVQKSDMGFQRIQNLITSNRFAIFDQSEVQTMGDIETYIDITGNEMVKRGLKPIAIVDSLHSIAMNVSSDRRLEVMGNIRELRRIANIKYMPIIGVAELRKGQSKQGNSYRRPSLRDFSETGDIEYRVTVGIILENQLKELGNERAWKTWREPTLSRDPLPILSAHVDKNKEGYFQGCLEYYTNPMWSEMQELTLEQQTAIREQPRHNANEGTHVEDIPTRTSVPTQPEPPRENQGPQFTGRW